MTISRTNCLRGFGPEFLSGRHSSVRRREPAARRAESFGAPGVPGARRQAPGPPCGGGSPRFILLAKRHPDGQGRHELILAWPIKTAGSRPRTATSFCMATKGRKNACSSRRAWHSPPLGGFAHHFCPAGHRHRRPHRWRGPSPWAPRRTTRCTILPKVDHSAFGTRLALTAICQLPVPSPPEPDG